MKALFWGILTATLLFTQSAQSQEKAVQSVGLGGFPKEELHQEAEKQGAWEQVSLSIFGTLLSGSLIGGFAWFLTTRSKLDTIPSAIATATQITEDKFEKQVQELQSLIADKADRMYQQLSCYIEQQRDLAANLHIVQDRLAQLPTAVEVERRLQVLEGKLNLLTEKTELHDKHLERLNDAVNSVTSRLIAEGFKFRDMDK